MPQSDLLYLGRKVTDRNEVTDQDVLYPLAHLTTHALLLGATGSGKTGLGLVLAEEALRQGVPVLLLDVKGDLTNLLLTFPDLAPDAFEPWIDADAAARHGQTPQEAATATATRWREGLAAWNLGPAAITELRANADLALYTPGMRAGRPVDIMARFSAPPDDDPDESAVRAQGLASALLGLAGIEADPLRSREHILITTLIRHIWDAREPLDIPTLIQQVQRPPVERVGVFDLESFFPQDERFELALTLNNLIAAPGFARWREGEPLEIERYLSTAEGRARASVFYLAHLPEEQRRFFLTLFLEEVRTWIRRQAGTRTLRALLYFDEVYGYLPPHPYNPPTKTPLMALVKQGRAAGLGVMLATQNPADLDYKGLGNIGTWFVGALRTERDKHRVLEGMEGTISASGLRTNDVEAALSRLQPRVFLMHDANEGTLHFFHSRWALSYLRGPLTDAEARTLAETVAPHTEETRVTSTAELIEDATPLQDVVRSQRAVAAWQQSETSHHPPTVDPGIPQGFLPATITASWALRSGNYASNDAAATRLVYRPYLLGAGVARLFSDRAGISIRDEQVWRIAPSDESWALRWEQAEIHALDLDDLSLAPVSSGIYEPLPRAMARKSDYPKWESAFKTHLYHHSEIKVWSCPPLKLYSAPNETKGAFFQRCRQELQRRKAEEIAEERRKFEGKIAQIEAHLQREELELDKQEDRLEERRREELLSGAESVLSIFSRRRVVHRPLSQTSRQRRYVKDAKAAVEESEAMLTIYEEQMKELETAWSARAEQIARSWDNALDQVDSVIIRAKRTDIDVRFCGVVWFPFWEVIDEDERHLLPAYVPQ